MSRGGARNRSGPAPDENSLASARKGLVFTALPSTYDGVPPEFPFPDQTPREAEVWAQAWTLPQANAWAVELWRHRTVAMWVRWSVRMEDSAASAALGATVMRLADQIGLTPAGLKENGWKIARDQVGEKREERKAEPKVSSKTRLRVVPNAAGGQ